MDLASSQCSSVGLMLCCSMFVFLSVVLRVLCPLFGAICCSFFLICIRSNAILLYGLRDEAKKLVSDGVLWKTPEGRFCRHGYNEGHYRVSGLGVGLLCTVEKVLEQTKGLLSL